MLRLHCMHGVPMMLYHLTPSKNLKRIARSGLRARSSRWNEGPRRQKANRIYFTTTRQAALQSMHDVLRKEDTRLGKRAAPDVYALLAVDPAGLKLYVDPEHPKTSVYVTRRVLASSIRLEDDCVHPSRRR